MSCFIEHRHGCDGAHNKRQPCNTAATIGDEVSDPLLDEATRLADFLLAHETWETAHLASTDGETVRALVERVQQAERRANFEEMRAASESIERDAARGKLDKVRTRITSERARAECDCEPDGYIDWLDDTIAILDGKE